MTPLYIVVDDLRIQPEGWELFKSAEAFIAWRVDNPTVPIRCLSLDHDLGVDVDTGYDLVHHMIEQDNFNCENIDSISFHTDNFVGLKNMYCYLSSAKRAGLLPNTTLEPTKLDLINGEFHSTGLKPGGC